MKTNPTWKKHLKEVQFLFKTFIFWVRSMQNHRDPLISAFDPCHSQWFDLAETPVHAKRTKGWSNWMHLAPPDFGGKTMQIRFDKHNLLTLVYKRNIFCPTFGIGQENLWPQDTCHFIYCLWASKSRRVKTWQKPDHLKQPTTRDHATNKNQDAVCWMMCSCFSTLAVTEILETLTLSQNPSGSNTWWTTKSS